MLLNKCSLYWSKIKNLELWSRLENDILSSMTDILCQKLTYSLRTPKKIYQMISKCNK